MRVCVLALPRSGGRRPDVRAPTTGSSWLYNDNIVTIDITAEDGDDFGGGGGGLAGDSRPCAAYGFPRAPVASAIHSFPAEDGVDGAAGDERLSAAKREVSRR